MRSHALLARGLLLLQFGNDRGKCLSDSSASSALTAFRIELYFSLYAPNFLALAGVSISLARVALILGGQRDA